MVARSYNTVACALANLSGHLHVHASSAGFCSRRRWPAGSCRRHLAMAYTRHSPTITPTQEILIREV